MACGICGAKDGPLIADTDGYRYCSSCVIRKVDQGHLYLTPYNPECSNCSRVAEYCEECAGEMGDCGYDHDDPSCLNCGACSCEATMLCTSCKSNSCDECGLESGGPDGLVYCQECAQEMWQTTPIHPAMIVGEDGSMTIGDQEVRWN